MSVHERRKKPRSADGLNGSAFIEIRHTFGPVRKSVYKVVEFNEHGTSFLMPSADGYFRSGHPLEFSLVTPDLAKMETFGIVRYYTPFHDDMGNSYFKVGVENKQIGRTSKQSGFRIRPKRLNLSTLSNAYIIYFSVDDRDYALPLVDISRYAAAFLCSDDDNFQLGVSSALDSVEIAVSERTIFEGTVIITRRTAEGEKYRIVIEPRSAIFDIDAIEEQERLSSVSRSVENLLQSTKKQSAIPPEFKAIVADMRSYLEGFREILDSPVAAKPSTEADRIALLSEMSSVFNPAYDAYWAGLEDLVVSLDLDDTRHSLYKSYLQGHIHPLILSAPICHRIYYKPLGYPGDYEMMRLIRENRYDGPTLFSKLVHAHALRNPMAAANRNRIEYLADKIIEEVARRPFEEVRILSIASGPALEIQHLIEKRPDIADRIRLTLLDQEVEALRYSQDSIYMKRILNNCQIKVDLIHQNVGAFLKQIARGRAELPQFDFIYIFGLFDYFDDRTCAFCINKSASLLCDGGKIIVSNYSLDGHVHRTFMEYAFEWFMIYRNSDQMKSLGSLVEKACSIEVEEEALGVIKFLSLDFGVKS